MCNLSKTRRTQQWFICTVESGCNFEAINLNCNWNCNCVEVNEDGPSDVALHWWICNLEALHSPHSHNETSKNRKTLFFFTIEILGTNTWCFTWCLLNEAEIFFKNYSCVNVWSYVNMVWDTPSFHMNFIYFLIWRIMQKRLLLCVAALQQL